MSFRIVTIAQRSKLDLRLGYLVIRRESDTKRVFLDEINILIIENPACALTGCLLAELIRRKIKVIFCDEKHSPLSELIPCHGSADCAGKLREQIAWPPETKTAVWTAVVREKIRNQSRFLRELGRLEAADLLASYIAELTEGDASNREGHAAKVYFNAVFELGFHRGDDIPVNSALNYGYAMLLSTFNREIAASGFNTQLGIFHCNQFNYFNLGCDLMEPFRILVDRFVYYAGFTDFSTLEKHRMQEIFEQSCRMRHEKQDLCNTIRIYTHSIFRAIQEENPDRIVFPDFFPESNETS